MGLSGLKEKWRIENKQCCHLQTSSNKNQQSNTDSVCVVVASVQKVILYICSMIGYDWNQENIKADSVFHSTPAALENSDGALNTCKKHVNVSSLKSQPEL